MSLFRYYKKFKPYLPRRARKCARCGRQLYGARFKVGRHFRCYFCRNP